MYHLSIFTNSGPALNQELNWPDKKKRKRMNNKLIAELRRNDDEAIAVFSLLLLPTNLICAFFKRFDLAVSNRVVTTKKNAQTPISDLERLRISIIKLRNPKSVTEKRWRNVNNADRIQYDDRYFFKGVASLRKKSNLHKNARPICYWCEWS